MLRISRARCRGCEAAAVLVLAAGAVSAAAAERLGDLTGPWQLFVDDHLVASRQGVARTYHAFEKHPANPVLVPDRPWEHNVTTCTTVLPAEDGRGYRMWYYCWTTQEDPDRSHALYAVSEDGITWHKPTLGLVAWKVNGSKDNNMVGASGSIMHTPHDPAPERRYKAVACGGYRFKASPDGLRWNPLSESDFSKGGDVGWFIWDPFVKRYRGYFKINPDVSGLRRRAVGFSEDTDYESWPTPRLVMAPDEVDDRWCAPGSVERTHFYGCPVVPYETMYFGLLWVYRADDADGYFHGPLFTELTSSRDGVHWLRQEGNRPPILDRGPVGSWDGGMVFGISLLVVGDELRLYYAGYRESHDVLPYHSAVGVATLRKDGLVSLDAGGTGGVVETKRLTGVSGPLRVNYQAAGGEVRVEVLDADGRVRPGYGRQQCEALTGDAVSAAVRWGDRGTLPADGEPVRLRFILSRASLYSFMAGEGVEVLPEPSGAARAVLCTFEEDWGQHITDRLVDDGAQQVRVLGTGKVDRDDGNAAFGKQAFAIDTPWRPLHRIELADTSDLGTGFTLAAMVRSANNRPARLFSAYSGNGTIGTSELVFDCDPRGCASAGLRLVCKGIAVESQPLKFDDGKYHHLAVTYDDGQVRFYLDGESAGTAWLPGGEPVRLRRDLLFGEDLELGSDEQLRGHVDDLLVLARVLNDGHISSLAGSGAEAFFAAGGDSKP